MRRPAYLKLLPRTEFERLAEEDEQYVDLKEKYELYKQEEGETEREINHLMASRHQSPNEVLVLRKHIERIRRLEESVEKAKKKLPRLESDVEYSKKRAKAERRTKVKNLRQILPGIRRRMNAANNVLGEYSATLYAKLSRAKKKRIIKDATG